MHAELSFAHWLKQRRRALDLTQEALAEAVGCAVQTIRKLESGERRPSRQVAERLAQALDIAADEQAGFLRFARSGPQGEPLPEPPSVPLLTPPAPARLLADTLPPSKLWQTNLPAPVNPLIDREQELASIVRLLSERKARLVTLSGPGGIGKTRLAVQAGGELLDHFKDGVYFVSLASIGEPALVAPLIAQSLGLRDTADQVLQARLEGFLRDKQLLLLLDNFEQLLGASALVARLLEASPGLALLITSRAVLNVRAEHAFPVPALPLPEGNARTLEVVSRSPAVMLFVERTRAARPSFALTAENSQAVAELCARLDGLPLAIELAAGRSKVLPPAMLLARLSSRLALLTAGPRDLPERQQTLRGAIEWSHNLLEPHEQILFRRLAVFAGGCTVEAAEAVCGASTQLDVLGGLASLADKSLLRQQGELPDDHVEPRFSMLETIREYALERLREHGEAQALGQRHLSYFLTLAEQASTQLRGPQQELWCSRLAREEGNLRAALEWSLLPPGPDTARHALGVRLVLALSEFWLLYGQWSEAGVWLKRALTLLETAPGLDQEQHARLHYHLAIMSGPRSRRWRQRQAEQPEAPER